MKYKVSKKTEPYLRLLEKEEKQGKVQKPYHNNTDTVDQLIIDNDLKIAGIHFHRELDLMLVVLNSKKVFTRNISDLPRMSNATREDLEAYELSPMGVHWPALNEDLSLRGFLIHEFGPHHGLTLQTL